MRTTLTIDDDVAARLAELQRQSGDGLKVLVNKALRAGLQVLDPGAEQRPQGRYKVRTSPGGQVRFDVTSVSEALAQVEGEAHK